MRILTTFIYPTGGTATVAGFDVTAEPIAARRAIGYLPESPPLYADMRVDEFLDFVGRARNLSGRRLAGRLSWVTDACGVASVWKHQIHELSLGYRQRVGLAQALVHDPKVVILDEPTSGLDPIQIIGIRKLIRDLAKTKTILFSTHILQEAAAISDRLIIMNSGRIAAQGPLAELTGRRPGQTLEEVFVSLFEKARS
jgi:ABC-2 type transport system ATP-binding protein